MNRKESLKKEIELASEKMLEWALKKLDNYSDKDIERESHLIGIDLLHDACHTLRGRLPKTEKVSLPAMSKLRDSE